MNATNNDFDHFIVHKDFSQKEGKGEKCTSLLLHDVTSTISRNMTSCSH